MKRAAAIFLAAALVLSQGTVSAHAAPQGRGRNHTDRDRGGFVDTDGDGVCDNRQSSGICPGNGAGRGFGRRNALCAGFVDADGDGVCDNCGFVDADGDGVCDNGQNGGVCPRNGVGFHHGRNGKLENG